ncbi:MULTISPECIES: substrate-binding periplasmic protein [unclassified Agarivorans]|uniref:substrate-binding periplasmic protein n=1 Tax=unclassified Agarivorans TaxID=2636026 RepID=UPI0026E3836B|nr:MULTISPECIES: ABC transporter substrate-binding protein [unclassified Agarivorans]MDO6687113.1 ABC transporter substrate-binding protein [Agarivorans sp. 3_MG-2023]MDO6713475.1 ABC transporter substrate-binding protein [Agarivorans sp. 2_MG-2023]
MFGRYLLAICLLLPLASKATTINFVTENLRPFNYVEDAHLTGISVELLRLVWQEMGEDPQPIKVKTWEKAYYLLQHRPNMALFLTMRSPRREHMFHWACPITTSDIELIALKSRAIEIDEVGSDSKILYGAMKAGVGEQLLLYKGVEFEQISLTDDLEKALRMLKRERVDVIASEPEVINQTAAALGFEEELFESVYPLGKLEGCYAFSQGTDPEYLERFRQALSKVTATEQYQRLLDKYQM